MLKSLKICSKCQQEQPLCEFYADKRRPDGRMGVCRRCEAIRVCKNGAAVYDLKQAQLARKARGVKLCSKCQQEKPLGEFCTDRRRPDGQVPWCKGCRVEAGRSEARRKWNAEWREENREELQRKKREYREKNLEKINQKQREWHQKRGREWRREYRRRKPDAVKTTELRRRARWFSAPGRFTVAEFDALCKKFGGRCLGCGKQGVKLTVDHVVPLSKGGSNSIDNIQPLCRSCNCSKQARVVDYRPK